MGKNELKDIKNKNIWPWGIRVKDNINKNKL